MNSNAILDIEPSDYSENGDEFDYDTDRLSLNLSLGLMMMKPLILSLMTNYLKISN
jgi:hypothetical protein